MDGKQAQANTKPCEENLPSMLTIYRLAIKLFTSEQLFCKFQPAFCQLALAQVGVSRNRGIRVWVTNEGGGYQGIFSAGCGARLFTNWPASRPYFFCLPLLGAAASPSVFSGSSDLRPKPPCWHLSSFIPRR